MLNMADNLQLIFLTIITTMTLALANSNLAQTPRPDLMKAQEIGKV